MPGIKSLQAQQYYAHPQNSFWPIMAAVFDMPVSTYPERVKLIEQSGLALWDVLKCCERHGSLDTNIDDDTIEVNDFAGFFAAHPDVTHVFFNGTKASAEFRRRVLPDLPEEIRTRLDFLLLPSTSPARANMANPLKLKAWRRALGLLTGR